MPAEIKGLAEVLDRIKAAGDEGLSKAAEAAVYGQGLALWELMARKKAVPVSTGRLAASGYLTLPTERDGALTSELGYGVDYADERHELRSGWFREVTRQWLLRSSNIWAAGMLVRLRESIVENLARGTTVQHLAGILPTSPQDPGPQSTTKANKAAVRRGTKLLTRAKRAKQVRLVRRFKRARGGPRG